MKIGFVGLGNMGQGMADNLLKNGIDLYVYTRTKSKIKAMEAKGASGANSPADLTRKVDIVLTCLPDVPTSEEVFLGEEGIVQATRTGQILVDHSTVGPSTSRKIYEASQNKGAFFLDAPISGGPGGATEGTLAIMAGGDSEAFDKVRPVFQAMGKTIMHMGPSGAGAVTKLVNQLLCAVHTLSSCEALLMGSKAGVDLDQLVEVLSNAWGGSKMLERNAPNIINREFGPSAAPLRNMFKDIGILSSLVEEVNITLPSLKAATKVFDIAKDKGMYLEDITAIYELLEQGHA